MKEVEIEKPQVSHSSRDLIKAAFKRIILDQII